MSERKTVTLTHKGWLGLCPVYFGDIDSEAPVVEPRWACVRWWSSPGVGLWIPGR